MVLSVLTGWLDRREREACRTLLEENRLLRSQLGGHRLGLTGCSTYMPGWRDRQVGGETEQYVPAFTKHHDKTKSRG